MRCREETDGEKDRGVDIKNILARIEKENKDQVNLKNKRSKDQIYNRNKLHAVIS